MKQIFNILFGLIITVIVAYIILIIVESVRLRNGAEQPLIVTGGVCDRTDIKHDSDYKTDCKSIGFSIRRKYELDTADNKSFNLIQEEFWILDRFMLWGWIS